MKKLFLLAGFYCLHFAGYAKGISVEEKDPSAISRINNSFPAGYTRALQHFNEAYPGIEHTTWETIPGEGFVCTFQIPGILTRVHYDPSGNWLFTISGYEASGLPKQIKENLSAKFPEYRIGYVNQISSADEPFYIINIENPEYIKVVRVTRERTDIVKVMENATAGDSRKSAQ